MVHKKLNSIRAAVYALVLALGALIAPPNTVYGQSSGDVIGKRNCNRQREDPSDWSRSVGQGNHNRNIHRH